MREKKDIRIFFALWPDVALRKQLSRAVRLMPVERPARRVPDYNLHLTLHFIGNVTFDELDCLQRSARQVVTPVFELGIDCHGHFTKSRVAWLGCGEVPEALQLLHRRLAECLQPCGYRPEKRRYNPHVTIARKMKSRPDMEVFEPLRWKVDNFVLIESSATDGGVRYEVIESYRLACISHRFS